MTRHDLLKPNVFDLFAVAFIALFYVADVPLWRAVALAVAIVGAWIAGGLVGWAVFALARRLLAGLARLSWRVRA